jgi:hypothetical protein
VDEAGCGWAEIEMALSVDGDVKTECLARIAIPTSDDDNPWIRRAERWVP